MDDIVYRKLYMDKMIGFKDTEFIKVITGIRRCGKSTLLYMMKEELIKSGVEKKHIIDINFESFVYSEFTYKELYEYVDRNRVEGKVYLLFDEIQKVENWQQAVNAFRVDFDCDIYITGSNAFLLSSELSTYLSGRYVEIKVYPLSFREFLDFKKITSEYRETETGKQWIGKNQDGLLYLMTDLLAQYIRMGGMPSVYEAGNDIEKAFTILDGIYSTVVIRDILEKGRMVKKRGVTDPLLLRKIVMFLADNIGNNTSATSISNLLLNEGLVNSEEKPAVHTVQTYIDALLNSFVFYDIKRFDIKGKQYLRTLGKYYIVDTGIRNYLLGFRDGDRGHILENVIYLELLRRGYSVSIGKIENKEIDFIAIKTEEKKYIQVTESISNQETRKRELVPLLRIKDNYEKLIITMEKDMLNEEQGIKIITAVDFLLSD